MQEFPKLLHSSRPESIKSALFNDPLYSNFALWDLTRVAVQRDLDRLASIDRHFNANESRVRHPDHTLERKDRATVLSISEQAVSGFVATQREGLAQRIFAVAPSLGSVEVARKYVDEALAVGIKTDRDIVEFTLLLAPLDQISRPAHIDALVHDTQTNGRLKVFQIYYALHGERP